MAVYEKAGWPVTCVRWPYAKMGHGYGNITIDKVQYRVHRVAWRLAYGDWPTAELDHVAGRGCVYRDCLNVRHLESVTQAENKRRIPKRRRGWNARKETRH